VIFHKNTGDARSSFENPKMDGDADPLWRFRRGANRVALVYCAVLAGGTVLLLAASDTRSALSWSVKAGVVFIYQLFFLFRTRRKAVTGKNLSRMWGPANIISLSRGVLIAVLAGFLLTSESSGLLGWFPPFLYMLISGADYLDGLWARRTHSQTNLGTELDQEFDGLGILVAVAIAVQYGHLPALFLIIGVVKYLFDFGVLWRRSHRLPVYDLPPSTIRRRLAGFQMGALAVFLWPIARPPVTTLVESLVGTLLMAGFIRDWLFVSGTLRPETKTYTRFKTAIGHISRKWIPLVLRLTMAGILGTLLYATVRNGFFSPYPFPPWLTHPWILPFPCLTVAFSVVRGLLLGALVVGFMPVSAAFLLLPMEAIRIFLTRPDLLGAVLITCTPVIWVLGGGPRALSSWVSGRLRRKASS